MDDSLELLETLKEDCLESILIFDSEYNGISCSSAARNKLGILENERMDSLFTIFPELENIKSFDGLNMDMELYRPNKTCLPVEIKTRVLSNGNIVVFARDITSVRNLRREIRHLKEDLEEQKKYKTEFVSNITHELRTPVNGIWGITKTLLHTELTAYQLENLNIIENCCNNMSKIINDLLDFSKLESNRLVLENKLFSFKEFFKKAMEFNVKAINEKGLKLVVYIGDKVPKKVIGDELRLTQILNNLIGNAIKFTQIGQISVEVSLIREEDDFVELFFMVVDTGIGIDKNNMNKLFEQFSQVDASTTRKFGGTGLGLSICKKLVEMMGGSIKVESEVGKGSTFYFNVILKKDLSTVENEKFFPTGNFIYEGNGLLSDSEVKSYYENKYRYDFGDMKSEKNRYKFGTTENIREIKQTLNKLLICIELENWEKAESFAMKVKKLVGDGETEKDVKKAVFRLEMSIRKLDHKGAIQQYNIFREQLTKLGF